MPTRNEIKGVLKDWMTATTQIAKVEQPYRTSQEIADLWKKKYGIKMTHGWVSKALGKKKVL
jgi:hypothetical protein